MADTCIVCLGDLAGAEQSETGSSDVPDTKLELPASTTKIESKSPEITLPVHDQAGIIAHLLPCGHDLHHECLKPWVERASSCPLCRQSFNEVELKNNVYGPCISSYAVQEKRQEADIDPSLVIDDDLFEEPATEPCIFCERYDDEDVLLLCDGCNGSCHTYCADLQSVPPGAWFCQFCHQDGTANANTRSRRRTTRTGAQRRQAAARGEQSPDAWASVWQSVWNNLNLDLEFPFDEDHEAAEIERAQRREFNQWQRRFRVAERQGGAARFRDTAATLLERRGGSRRQTPHPESQDELRAWNAFDKAREVSTRGNVGASRRNKRRSPTESAAESSAEPQAPSERALKRPRTRRTQQLVERQGPLNVESPEAGLQEQRLDADDARANSPRHEGPGFFHSLLREVQTSPSTPKSNPLRDPFAVPPTASCPSSEPPSPLSSSPASPVLSAHSSPRSRSLSPTRLQLSRSSSPPLTSSILPVFGQQGRRASTPGVNGHSPSNGGDISHAQSRKVPPPTSSSSKRSVRSRVRRVHARVRAVPRLKLSLSLPKVSSLTIPHSAQDNPQSSEGHSPSMKSNSRTRLEQVRSTKAEIQAMVAAALQPVYQKQDIDKDQYTDINRDVSRKLYDQVNEGGGLAGDTTRDKWRAIAVDEVKLAMGALNQSIKVEEPAVKAEEPN